MNDKVLDSDGEPALDAPARPKAGTRRKRPELDRRNLPLLMLVARESVTGFFRPIFNEFGLTEQQWRIIRALYEEGELMISQVAERTFIAGSSLSGILQRMIEADLLVKRLDPGDTRRFYVSLTRTGRSTFEAMVPRVQQAYAELEAKVGADDLDEIYTLMDRVLSKIGRSSAP